MIVSSETLVPPGVKVIVSCVPACPIPEQRSRGVLEYWSEEDRGLQSEIGIPKFEIFACPIPEWRSAGVLE